MCEEEKRKENFAAKKNPPTRARARRRASTGLVSYFPLSAGNGKPPAARPTTISRLKAGAFLSSGTYTCTLSLLLRYSFIMYLSRCSRSAARLLPIGSSRAAIVSARASIAPRLAPQSRGVSTRDTQHKVKCAMYSMAITRADSISVACIFSGGLRPRSVQYLAEGASSLMGSSPN